MQGCDVGPALVRAGGLRLLAANLFAGTLVTKEPKIKTFNQEILSESEIEARFRGEYVAVEVLGLDEAHVITRGVVIAHGPDKTAVREALRAHNPRKSALLCLAPRPKNRAYWL